MSITERDWRMAYDEGRRARRAGKQLSGLPRRDRTLRGEKQHEACEDGWNDENTELLALATAGVRVPA